jgi:hypothetical protein
MMLYGSVLRPAGVSAAVFRLVRLGTGRAAISLRRIPAPTMNNEFDMARS